VCEGVPRCLWYCSRSGTVVIFNSVEDNCHRHSFRIVILGDFNVPGYDLANGFLQAISHYYIKIRRDVIGNTASYFGLYQFNDNALNTNFFFRSCICDFVRYWRL
jgi:hypothetical protein